MIIETENSIYEIKDSQIRKVSGSGDCIGEDFVDFDYLVFPPEIGRPLAAAMGDGLLRTTAVVAIQNEED
jgi:hypothetical protein